MSKNIILVSDWLLDNSQDIVQLPKRAVVEQLEALDKAGSGIGYIIVALPEEVEREMPEGPSPAIAYPPEIDLQVTSFAVFKMRNQWYIVDDDNIGDIAKGLIGMLTAAITL